MSTREGDRPQVGAALPHAPGSEPAREAVVPRLFLREQGWHVHRKLGSERMFCSVMLPGETFYHRLSDGEIYLQRGDDRLCVPCADRHGLLRYEPRGLRPSVREAIEQPGGMTDGDAYDLGSESSTLGG